MTNLFRFLCAAALGIAHAAFAAPIDVLWYTYADPSSQYVTFYSSVSGSGPDNAQSSGVTWNVTFFGPSSPSPAFADYDVLVIQSGEAFRTGAPGGPLATPNYSGILNNKSAIEAARGNRTFISGSDADFHAVRGDSGLCPEVSCGSYDGARGYVINAVDWAASGDSLGIVSFYHGEFPGSFWWDDPSSFLRSELQGQWINFSPDENAVIIPASIAGYPLNQNLSSVGLSNWFNSFHAGFSNIPGYASTVDSGPHAGFSVSIATAAFVDGSTSGPGTGTCRPGGGTNCVSATVDEPSSVFLLAGSICLLFFALRRPSMLLAQKTEGHRKLGLALT
jgi:hypothetical protein